MGTQKIERLAKRIKERTGNVLLSEMNDPRLGFVTVTRVQLARDLRHCLIFYSVLGPETERAKAASALEHARGFVQRKIAEILRTRTTPTIAFKYDESVEGSIRVSKLIDEISKEWKAQEAEVDSEFEAEGEDAGEDSRRPD